MRSEIPLGVSGRLFLRKCEEGVLATRITGRSCSVSEFRLWRQRSRHKIECWRQGGIGKMLVLRPEIPLGVSGRLFLRKCEGGERATRITGRSCSVSDSRLWRQRSRHGIECRRQGGIGKMLFLRPEIPFWGGRRLFLRSGGTCFGGGRCTDGTGSAEQGSSGIFRPFVLKIYMSGL